MPLKRAVTEFGKTYKDRFALRTYPGTSVPIFIFILGWSRTKPRVTLSAQTMLSTALLFTRMTNSSFEKKMKGGDAGKAMTKPVLKSTNGFRQQLAQNK